MGKTIRVLRVAPGEHPMETTLVNGLDELQKAVSIGATYQGLIGIIEIEDGVCILCNEEGKLIGLEGNRRKGISLNADDLIFKHIIEKTTKRQQKMRRCRRFSEKTSVFLPFFVNMFIIYIFLTVFLSIL